REGAAPRALALRDQGRQGAARVHADLLRGLGQVVREEQGGLREEAGEAEGSAEQAAGGGDVGQRQRRGQARAALSAPSRKAASPGRGGDSLLRAALRATMLRRSAPREDPAA